MTALALRAICQNIPRGSRLARGDDAVEAVRARAGIGGRFGAVGGAGNDIEQFRPRAAAQAVGLLHGVGLVGDGVVLVSAENMEQAEVKELLYPPLEKYLE
jgi:hypothetical protein